MGRYGAKDQRKDPSSMLLGSGRALVQGLLLCNIGTGLLSNQGEKSINFYFIRVPLRKKVLKYGTPKPREQPGVHAANPVSFGLTAAFINGKRVLGYTEVCIAIWGL